MKRQMEELQSKDLLPVHELLVASESPNLSAHPALFPFPALLLTALPPHSGSPRDLQPITELRLEDVQGSSSLQPLPTSAQPASSVSSTSVSWGYPPTSTLWVLIPVGQTEADIRPQILQFPERTTCKILMQSIMRNKTHYKYIEMHESLSLFISRSENIYSNQIKGGREGTFF